MLITVIVPLSNALQDPTLKSGPLSPSSFIGVVYLRRAMGEAIKRNSEDIQDLLSAYPDIVSIRTANFVQFKQKVETKKDDGSIEVTHVEPTEDFRLKLKAINETEHCLKQKLNFIPAEELLPYVANAEVKNERIISECLLLDERPEEEKV